MINKIATAPLKVMLIILTGLALILNLLLEILGRHSLTGAFGFLFAHPVLFLYNSLIILLTLSICLIAKKRLTLLLLLSTIWIALGVTNCIVLAFRASPLSAIDFLIVKAAIGMFTIYLSVIQIIVIAIMLVAFIGLMVYLFIKCPKCNVAYHKSIACIAVIGLSVYLATMFAAESKALESESNSELVKAYESYGFAYCFTRSLLSQGVDKPDSYGTDKLGDLLDSLDSVTIEEPPLDDIIPPPDDPIPPDEFYKFQFTPEQLEKPNIIFVQLESFFDVEYVKWLKCSEDPTPTFTSLKANGVSGFLRVANVGGGTANSEFEVLTGMNLDHFGFGEYPYTTVLKTRACESIAANLKSLGYSTHAIHNHTATFYDRNVSYASLGFDTFTPVELMSGVRYNPLGWECDDIMTDQILSALNSTAESDFVFAVTVQGHGKYPEEPLDVDEFDNNSYLAYGDGKNQPVKVSGLRTESEHSQYSYYVNQLRETDNFIRELLDELTMRNEPCVVVFYGDHMPALALTEDDIYNGDLYQTEYAIWTNTEMFGDCPNLYDLDLEAYMLSAYVQSLCGISEGSITKLHQSELQTGKVYDEELRVLEYAQLYDNSSDIKYEISDLKFGTDNIHITGWETSGNSLYVYGSGFNKYSTVKLGGFARTTTLVSENKLRVDNIYFYEGIPEVVQISGDGTELAKATFPSVLP
ncbi:MAG: LTA synthase family protein [Clostridiales bacterium]|nr:LTA synthase family protein [Clostridiales bacterium]